MPPALPPPPGADRVWPEVAVREFLAAPVERGVSLYVDMVFEKGPQPTLLEDWYLDIVRTLQEKAGLTDLRYAPNDHDLAYGRWRGALSAVVIANPLPPGEYLFRGVGESDVKQVVLEALAPLCARVVRCGR